MLYGIQEFFESLIIIIFFVGKHKNNIPCNYCAVQVYDRQQVAYLLFLETGVMR